MLDTAKSVRIDDVVLALEQNKFKPAVSLLREVLAQPFYQKREKESLAVLAERVADACLKHGEEQDAASIYRLLICEDCGLRAESDVAAITRSKLLQSLVDLGQLSPASFKSN